MSSTHVDTNNSNLIFVVYKEGYTFVVYLYLFELCMVSYVCPMGLVMCYSHVPIQDRSVRIPVIRYEFV